MLVIIDAEPKDHNIGLPTEAYIAVEEVHDVSIICLLLFSYIILNDKGIDGQWLFSGNRPLFNISKYKITCCCILHASAHTVVLYVGKMPSGIQIIILILLVNNSFQDDAVNTVARNINVHSHMMPQLWKHKHAFPGGF